MAEARIHHRYDFLATAVIKTENNHNVHISSLVENISKNGLCLQTYQSLKTDSNISVELMFTTRTREKAKALVQGRVARVSCDGGVYILGIAFDQEITPENHPILFKYFSKGPIKFIL